MLVSLKLVISPLSFIYILFYSNYLFVSKLLEAFFLKLIHLQFIWNFVSKSHILLQSLRKSLISQEWKIVT